MVEHYFLKNLAMMIHAIDVKYGKTPPINPHMINTYPMKTWIYD